MARKDAPPSFQFYPADFLSSTAVSAMTCEELGGYTRLLCQAWLQDHPGHLPDDEELLARLSGLNGRWSECRTAIRRAFAERSGELVQRRMVEERDAQRQRYLQAAKGASVTNAKRWASVAQRSDSESHSARSGVTPSSSSSSSKDSSLGVGSSLASDGRALVEGVSAATFAKAKSLFPDRDLDLIEAKLLEYHARRPYRSLNRAFLSWCSRAKRQGTEALAERNGQPLTAEVLTGWLEEGDKP